MCLVFVFMSAETKHILGACLEEMQYLDYLRLFLPFERFVFDADFLDFDRDEE